MGFSLAHPASVGGRGIREISAERFRKCLITELWWHLIHWVASAGFCVDVSALAAKRSMNASKAT
jgi:hypothetical protein